MLSRARPSHQLQRTGSHSIQAGLDSLDLTYIYIYRDIWVDRTVKDSQTNRVYRTSLCAQGCDVTGIKHTLMKGKMALHFGH